MRILQLCHKPPNPAKDGGCIAMNNITFGLIKAGHKVKVLSIHTHKHPFEPEKTSSEYRKNTSIEAVFVDTRINLVDAFSNLVTQDSYNVSRFFSVDFDIILTRVLKYEEYDVVLLESLFMTPYIATIRRYSQAKIALRSHNLEYIIWERVAKGSRNPAKRSYLKLLARQLKKYELQIFKEVDGIVAISSADEKKYLQLGYPGQITTVPFGIDTEKLTYAQNGSEGFSLFHLGSMDWTPNLEGVNWFLDNVWPLLHKQLPDVTLYLAGRHMPDEIVQRNLPNLKIVGEVDDAYRFMQSHGIMVVPLLSAGGIRVKIIEGMALGKVVVSTTIGAEGIDYQKGKHLCVANTPQEFVREIDDLYQQPEKLKRIASAARQLVLEKFDNRILTEKLIGFFQQLSHS